MGAIVLLEYKQNPVLNKFSRLNVSDERKLLRACELSTVEPHSLALLLIV